MNQMKKKLISMIVMLVVLFSSMNITAYAAEGEGDAYNEETTFQTVSRLITGTNFGKASCFGTGACFGSVYFRVLADDHSYYDGAAGIANYLKGVFIEDESGSVSVNPSSSLRRISYTDAMTVINFASAFSSYEEYILRNNLTMPEELGQQKSLAIKYFNTVDNTTDGYHTHTAGGPYTFPSMGIAAVALGSLTDQYETERFETLIKDAYTNADAAFYNANMYLQPFYQLCAKYDWFDKSMIPAVPETLTASDVLTLYGYGVDLANEYPAVWQTYVNTALSDNTLDVNEAKAFAYHYAYQLTEGDVWLGVYGSSRDIVGFSESGIYGEIDEATGTLNLSGYGVFGEEMPSWSAGTSKIQYVNIGNGIRSNAKMAPVIKSQPVGITLEQNDAITSHTLSVNVQTEAAAEPTAETSSDRYAFEWYSNTENSTAGGIKLTEKEALGEATGSTYKASVDTSQIGTMYYYCRVIKMDAEGRISWTWSMPAAVEIKEAQAPSEPTTENIIVTFSLYGDSEHGAEQSHSMTEGTMTPWVTNKLYIMESGSTAWDVLQKAAKENGFTLHSRDSEYGIYIEGVTYGGISLYEFDNESRNSGWMYRVNGTLPPVTVENYTMRNGDNLVFHFTDDYTKENETISMNGSDLGNDIGASTPSTPDVSTSGTTGATTTTTPTEVTVSGSTATATVKSENAVEAIKQAKENKSAEIVLNVAASDTKGAETVKIQLDTATVKSVVSDTGASLTVKTENGQVSLDREALTTIASEAKGTTITLEVVKVDKPTETQQQAAGTNGQVLQLVVKSGDKIISDFNKGKATVTVEIPAKLQDKKVAAIYIAEDGQIEQMSGKTVKIDGKDYYTFETPHFSAFALVDAEELGLEAGDEDANIERIKELVSDMSLKASSSKTSEKNIKVTLTVDKSTAAAIKEIKDMGYTVKYKYYRSTKKASKYQAKVTKTTKSFTNTAGKKGTKYYYKARIQVYDKDGNLVAQTALKQCRYAARTWTK